jgi:hypothetical protein
MPVSTKDKGKTFVGTDAYPVFVEGDIVTINSGGPNMTVIDILDDTDEVVVTYATGEGGLEILGFPSAAVRKVVVN